jgi:hypothetical protein
MRSIQTGGNKKDFPKLMINENVIALFSSETNAVCVHRISDDAIDVGVRLSSGSFRAEKFSDYHGYVELSNL